MSLYTQDGVNIESGDDFSAYAGRMCQASYGNNPFVRVEDLTAGNFRGPRGFFLHGLPKECLETTVNDGIGTKVVLIQAARSFEHAAADVLAMVTSDISRYGGLPLIFTSVLDVANLGEEGSESMGYARDLLSGLGRLAKEQDLVVLTGETAELGTVVGSDYQHSPLKFNRAGTLQGVYHPEKMITGEKIEPGDIVIALKEQGFRSNGISSVRKAFALRFGEYRFESEEALPYIKQAAAPSLLYDRLIASLHGRTHPDLKAKVDLHAIAHISGGGIVGKFGYDMLRKKGYGAELSTLRQPPAIMQSCAQWRGMSDHEAYQAWNGGQGMLLVVGENDVDIVLEEAKLFHIQAQVAGYVHEKSKELTLISQFLGGEKLSYGLV